MDGLLLIGVLIATGLVLGEVVEKMGLPRVTGYILAGVLLNPDLFHIIPQSFVQDTETIISIALAILTFSVGGTLSLVLLRELGKGVLLVAVGAAELSALAVTGGMMIALPFLAHLEGATFLATYLPVGLLLGSLASPTDPTATLAVMHQYKVKGPVSFSIMAAAAIDDALGIINFSVATVIAAILINHVSFQPSSLFEPLLAIGGAVLLGVGFGLMFQYVSRFLHAQTEGLFIVLILATLTLCYGIATLVGFDQLLATMTVGITVVNFGRDRGRIFRLIENYAEPLVFVLFFTISGLYLDFSILLKFLPIVLLFVVFRSAGKLIGAYAGALLAHSSKKIRRYTGWGLISEGGIVIGLALILRQNPGFVDVSDIIISVIIGATVIHELIGPLTAKVALEKAGEFLKDRKQDSDTETT